MKTKLIVVASIIILLGIVYLLAYSPLPKISNYNLHLNQVRELVSKNSKLPTKIHSLKVATGVFPCWFQVAGECNDGSIEFRVFQLVYEDGTSIIIDPVHDYEQHLAWPFYQDYNQKAFDRMQESLKEASKIIFTHGHFDHAGGAFRSPYFDQLKKKIVVNEKQYYGNSLPESFTETNTLEGIKPIVYSNNFLIAPGVVLIAAPGHTQGNQIVYVKMKDGKEVMFIGDIVWSSQNFIDEKGRPKLVSLLMTEDGELNNAEIKTLLPYYFNDEIKLIVAHDSKRISKQISTGLLVDGLFKN